MRKHYYINDNKLRVTVSIDNEAQGVMATTLVEHVETDSHGYTCTSHTVFKDYYKRILIGEKVKRVTTKVKESWNTLSDSLYKSQLSAIQAFYA